MVRVKCRVPTIWRLLFCVLRSWNDSAGAYASKIIYNLTLLFWRHFSPKILEFLVADSIQLLRWCFARFCLWRFVSKVNWRTVDILLDEMEVMLSAVPRAGRLPGLKEPTRVRTEFPETWLWSESTAGYQASDAFCYQCCNVWVTQPVHVPPELYTISHVLFWWPFFTPDLRIFGNCQHLIITLMFLHVFVCAGLCEKSAGTMRRSCMIWSIFVPPLGQWMRLAEVHQVRRSRQEYAQNFQKLGCGPSQAPGTIWHHVLPMLQNLSPSAGAFASKIFSNLSLPFDGSFSQSLRISGPFIVNCVSDWPLLLLPVFVCAGLCWKSTGTMQRSCMVITIIPVSSCHRCSQLLLVLVFQVWRSRREYIWNSRKLGCGLCQSQSINHLTPDVLDDWLAQVVHLPQKLSPVLRCHLTTVFDFRFKDFRLQAAFYLVDDSQHLCAGLFRMSTGAMWRLCVIMMVISPCTLMTLHHWTQLIELHQVWRSLREYAMHRIPRNLAVDGVEHRMQSDTYWLIQPVH